MNRPPRGNNRSDASMNSPASEFNTTSTPRPVGGRQEFLFKIQRPGIGDMVIVKTHLRAMCPTYRGWRWRNLQSPVPGQLHRSHSHATGSGMNQHLLTRPVPQPTPPTHTTPSKTPPAHPRPRPTTTRGAPYDQPISTTASEPAPPEYSQYRVADRKTAHPGPTSTTTPAPSAPSTATAGYIPNATNTSRKFTPTAATATRTCPACKRRIT